MAKEQPEKPAGIQSGVTDKTPFKGGPGKLSKPDADYEGSAKQGKRGEKAAGGGFSWK